MNSDELAHFVHEAALQTYLMPGVMPNATPLRPKCDEFSYTRGDWKYHDSYAWKQDGGGEILVYFKEEPVWVLNYYGYLIGEPDRKETYDFLHEALKQRHPVLPVRGDAHSDTVRGLKYEVEYTRSEIGNFVGVERIFKDGIQVYECYLHGGFAR